MHLRRKALIWSRTIQPPPGLLCDSKCSAGYRDTSCVIDDGMLSDQIAALRDVSAALVHAGDQRLLTLTVQMQCAAYMYYTMWKSCMHCAMIW